MAAAYLLGIVKNHAFVDANKRTGMLACLYFMDRNGFSTDLSPREIERIALDVATGRLDKPALARLLKRVYYER